MDDRRLDARRVALGCGTRRVRGCVAHRRKVDEQLADASRRQKRSTAGAILSLDSRWCLITVRFSKVPPRQRSRWLLSTGVG